jgi:site-specific DNA-methyltransferase (adenine-specific)
MAKKFITDLIEVYNSDNQKILKSNIEDDSIDLVLTDPPYKDYHSNRRKNESINIKKIHRSDYNPIRLIDEIARVLKKERHFYIWTDDSHFSELYQAIVNHPDVKYKNMLIWVKNNHGAGDLKGNYSPQYELIIYGVKGKGRPLFGNRKPNVFFRKENDCIKFISRVASNSSQHGTIKPVEILQQLIEKSTKKNETVLDMYAGSMTTGIACLETERKCILIEKDTFHFKNGVSEIKKLIKKLYS